MAISMTGFGRGEFKNDNYHFLVECKTINHKYCDINVRLPRKISFLEDKIRNYVKNFVKRGRVDLYIKLDLIGSEDVNLKFDDKLATQYVGILNQIKDTKAQLMGVNTKTTKERIAIIDLNIEVENIEELNKVIRVIKKVDSVYEVRR